MKKLNTTENEIRDVWEREQKMSEVKWTEEQKNAISKKGSNILVAAAARKWENSSFSWTYYKKNYRRQNRYR